MTQRRSIEHLIQPTTEEEDEANAVAFLESPDHDPEERERIARMIAGDEFVDRWLAARS